MGNANYSSARRKEATRPLRGVPLPVHRPRRSHSSTSSLIIGAVINLYHATYSLTRHTKLRKSRVTGRGKLHLEPRASRYISACSCAVTFTPTVIVELKVSLRLYLSHLPTPHDFPVQLCIIYRITTRCLISFLFDN